MRLEEWAGMGKAQKVEVGMKCTIHYYSDSHPAEVVKVSKSGNTCYIRRHEVTADPNSEGGMGHQDWLYKEGDFMKVWNHETEKEELAEKPDNYTYYKVTKRKNGAWRTSRSNCYVAFGQWKEYFDWSF